MRIKPDLLHQQVEAWQEVELPFERAEAIAEDVNRFNDSALKLSANMEFEAEPGGFTRVLEQYAEDETDV